MGDPGTRQPRFGHHHSWPTRNARTLQASRLTYWSLVDVKAVFGQNHVVFAFFPEGGSQANVEFVRFAESCVGVCVVPKRVACLYALNKSAKDGIQMGDVLDVEKFTTGLVHHLANVDQAGNHTGREESLRRVVAGNFQVIEDGVGGDGFGDDVARNLSSRVGADVIADEDDDAATFGRRLEEIFRGDEDPVVDIGGASGVERIDLLGV